ncbi:MULTISPECIES: serine hydrolase [Pseudomonas]|uniref:serine hydrolase domain-containing protein n=1 Tax=Pseudomonas TaxID=286 RepID=UPI000CFE4EF3|nr:MULTISPECIES: serine hydrolase domain-containing protein [Pseudomonas]PRA45846.1 serine hydrolase [Pseudomonas sp. MYb115]QXN52294.1 beta-lactamase family protein [Pseudomonas fluorescens]WSO26628.1 serine hydrolase domain-containing protein [Pseudomonas fluorescens]
MPNNNKCFDPAALQRLDDAIKNDIEAGLYDGANIILARHGQIGYEASIGWADKENGRHATPDDIYRVFSLTKAFTNVMVLQAIDRGILSLTTKVVDLIPEFYGRDRFRSGRKDRINLAHLLTHRAGLVPTPCPLPYDQLGDMNAVVDAICQLDVTGEPGVTLNYSPTLNHVLMAEMVRRASGANRFKDLLQNNLFDSLGMSSTALGAPDAWSDRYVPIRARFPDGGWLSVADIEVMNDIINSEAEMPWVGAVSTARDVFKFAEMLRSAVKGAEGTIISSAMMDVATTNQTGDQPSDLYKALAEARGWEVPPANFGLGFALSGSGLYPSYFGPTTSPRTFGNYGAGSTLFWVDPAREVTFVCLTAGIMEESGNLLRFQRLSTLAIAAAI